MIYLTLDEVLDIHEDQIAVFGGSRGIRDRGLIEAALLRPQTGYYNDIVEEAAALWESLAMNHGFVDGNKRVALATTEVFLEANGYLITATNNQLIDFIYGHLEAGTFTKDNLNDWLRGNVIEKRID
ncbi:MAG: type II toxin-antitoxin system death-on-curing family toxin [Devosiaceae bacterium]|nr:type II toxin-antitoxin system death-on-curing family toxin [Devosiaceae bacterium]